MKNTTNQNTTTDLESADHEVSGHKAKSYQSSNREAFINRQTAISLGELALIAGTRALAGGGAGLLVSGALTLRKRKSLGWALLGIGLLSTIPLARDVFKNRRASNSLLH